MKTCKDCHIEKQEDKFYKNPSCLDGLNPYCIECFTKRCTKNIDKKNCGVCGKNFQPKSDSQNYCSSRCKKISKKDKKECKNCGGSFYTGIDGGKHKYCSLRCSKIFRGHAVDDRECRECGEVFTPNENGARYKYCSSECAEYKPSGLTKSSCRQCGKDIEGRADKMYCSKKCNYRANYERNSKHTITCIGCGDEAVVTQKDGKYCSDECFQKHTDYAHLKERELNRECITCGKEYVTGCTTSKYCSDSCNPGNWESTRIYFKKCKGCFNTYVATRINSTTCSDKCNDKYRLLYSRLYELRTHYQKQKENPEVCTHCGDEFIRKYGEKAKLCSDKCREESYKEMQRRHKYKRKMLKRGAGVYQNIYPMEVLRRDKHRCQMCGCKTPKRLRGTHKDNAPEIDHIVPLSKGGNHSYNNVQTLCRNCNQTKSNHYIGQQPLQFGGHEGGVSPIGEGGLQG